MDGEQVPEQPRPVLLPPFTTVLAESWRLYAANLRSLFGLFAFISLVITIIPTLIVFEIAASIALPLYLLIGVVLPSVLASIGFGLTALVLWNRARTGFDAELYPTTVRGALSTLGSERKELLASALLSGMIGLALALFLGFLGLLLQALFFGPPVLIQAIALERLTLQQAWPRAGVLIKGATPRVVLYLLTIVLGIGLLSALTLSLLAELFGGIEETVRFAVLGALQIFAVGLTLPLLACASFVVYCHLRVSSDAAGQAAVGEGEPSPG